MYTRIKYVKESNTPTENLTDLIIFHFYRYANVLYFTSNALMNGKTNLKTYARSHSPTHTDNRTQNNKHARTHTPRTL